MRRLVVPAAVGVLALGGCARTGAGGGEGAGGPVAPSVPPAEVVITFRDGSFHVPRGVEAEPVRLRLSNEDEESSRSAFFARLNEGVSRGEVEEAFTTTPEALLGMVTIAGSLPPAAPGSVSEAVFLFPEGTYLVMDAQTQGSLPPTSFFEVGPARGPPVAEPEPDWTITAGDFYFRIGDPVPGEALVKLSNEGEQSHEVGIARGPEGQFGEAVSLLAPPPGGAMWTTVDLPAGTYTAFCFLVDPSTGQHHVDLGMQETFTVG